MIKFKNLKLLNQIDKKIKTIEEYSFILGFIRLRKQK